MVPLVAVTASVAVTVSAVGTVLAAPLEVGLRALLGVAVPLEVDVVRRVAVSSVIEVSAARLSDPQARLVGIAVLVLHQALDLAAPSVVLVLLVVEEPTLNPIRRMSTVADLPQPGIMGDLAITAITGTGHPGTITRHSILRFTTTLRFMLMGIMCPAGLTGFIPSSQVYCSLWYWRFSPVCLVEVEAESEFDTPDIEAEKVCKVMAQTRSEPPRTWQELWGVDSYTFLLTVLSRLPIPSI